MKYSVPPSWPDLVISCFIAQSLRTISPKAYYKLLGTSDKHIGIHFFPLSSWNVSGHQQDVRRRPWGDFWTRSEVSCSINGQELCIYSLLILLSLK